MEQKREKLTKMLEQLDDTTDAKKQEELKQKIFNIFGTDKKCFRCKSQLLISDLKNYSFLCLKCDENMFNFEAIDF
jgi:acetyl-CoA carboxylase beta subunit